MKKTFIVLLLLVAALGFFRAPRPSLVLEILGFAALVWLFVLAFRSAAARANKARPAAGEGGQATPTAGPGTAGRPIGDVESFLQDLKARGFSPRGILDVGANRGDWSQRALWVFPSAKTVMIEPQDEVEHFLKKLSDSDPRFRYFKCGAGREAGELVQTLWEDTYGSSFAVEKNEELVKSGKQRLTKIRTIDDILRELGDSFHPDLVKIDIQGFEIEALMGGSALFERAEVIILETTLLSRHATWPSTRQVIEFMGGKGYEIYDITSYLRKPSDGALGQVDFAFVKDHGRFRQNAAW